MAFGIDTTNPAGLPPGLNPQYVGGYVDGIWPDVDEMHALYPSAIPIAFSAVPGSSTWLQAHGFDGERGDYSPEQAANAAKWKTALGQTPFIYCSFANWPAYRAWVYGVGLDANHIDWLIAAYPGIGPVLYPGTRGHQFADVGPYDEWVIQDGWVPGRSFKPPPPIVTPPHIAALIGGKSMERTPTNNGYWQLKHDGSVWSFGDAQYHGGANAGAPIAPGVLAPQPHGLLNAPGEVAVDLVATSTGKGYWIETSAGNVFAFGDAPFHGHVASE